MAFKVNFNSENPAGMVEMSSITKERDSTDTKSIADPEPPTSMVNLSIRSSS